MQQTRTQSTISKKHSAIYIDLMLFICLIAIHLASSTTDRADRYCNGFADGLFEPGHSPQSSG